MSLEDFLHPYLRRYTDAPQWVKWGAGVAYRSLPMRLRHGAAFAGFARELGHRDPQEIARLERGKLAATINWAIETVPAFAAYRDIDRRSDDPRDWLVQLPLTDKLDIKVDGGRYLSSALGAGARLAMFTGGSTSNPMSFFLHKGVSRPKEAAYIGDFDHRAGITGHEVILNLRGRTVTSAGRSDGKLWSYEPIRRHLILSSDHLEVPFMPQYMAALREWRPTAVQAFPSAIYPLARWLAAHPEPEITERIRSIQLTSETVFGYQLELLRKVFSCPILTHYGHSERVLMACTMPDDDRYFFWPLYGHLELVDSEGKTITKPGVAGEIVGTSFDNQVMPFIRYRTGDIGAWSDRPGHPALPGFPVLERIDGRIQEFVVCRDHRLVSVTTLGAAHFQEIAFADAIQYEQLEAGKLVLKLQTREPLPADLLGRIAHAVEVKTQHGCKVEVQAVGKIERSIRGKQKLVVQHLDLEPYWGAGLATRHMAPAPMPASSDKLLVMVGTSRSGAGGIASVISTYADHGLFNRWPSVVVESHVNGSRLKKWQAFASALVKFSTQLRTHRVGLVHLQTSSGGSFWRKTCFALLAFSSRTPVLLHIHSGGFMSFYHDRCGPLRRRLIRFVFERSACVIALSPSWQERFLSIAPKARICCIANPVLASPGAARQMGKKNVLFLGKLCQEKGVFDLIDAWATVALAVPEARLVLGGSGNLAATRKKISALGLEGSISTPGWVAGKEKESLLTDADVFVLPSYFEGMPMSILEAFAAGIPCIATTVGGIPDMMTDCTEGRLVAPGDIEALSKALLDTLSNREAYEAMSRAALTRFTSHYAADVSMPALECLYETHGLRPLPGFDSEQQLGGGA